MAVTSPTHPASQVLNDVGVQELAAAVSSRNSLDEQGLDAPVSRSGPAGATQLESNACSSSSRSRGPTSGGER